jgi:hypothetical protein
VLIVLDREAHFWASTGPTPHHWFDGRDHGTPWLVLELGTPCELSGSRVAEGHEIGVDLAPGSYTLSVRHWPTGLHREHALPTLAYRFSNPKDATCAPQFLSKGLPDWNGESPVSVRGVGDLNHDGLLDSAAVYQASAMGQMGTRLLVQEAYPRCARVVFDGVGTWQESCGIERLSNQLYALVLILLASAAA